MRRPQLKRTIAIGLTAAVAAIGGGAIVANAADHASFASGSSAQGGPGGMPGGRLPGGGVPGGQPPTSGLFGAPPGS
jgi:hypothetical protein